MTDNADAYIWWHHTGMNYTFVWGLTQIIKNKQSVISTKALYMTQEWKSSAHIYWSRLFCRGCWWNVMIQTHRCPLESSRNTFPTLSPPWIDVQRCYHTKLELSEHQSLPEHVWTCGWMTAGLMMSLMGCDVRVINPKRSDAACIVMSAHISQKALYI